MTTPEQIRSAYSNTCQCRNGYSIEDCLKNERGEKTNTVCDILNYMRYENSPFGSWMLHSDGGIKIFSVLYKFGEYEIIVKEFNSFNEYPFDTVETFSKWLNKQEKRILAYATLLTND